MPLVLASSSPRRRELLSTLIQDFSVCPADIDESVLDGEDPIAYVQRLAREKAIASAERLVARGEVAGAVVLILGSDTSGILDDEILVKPVDYKDYKGMMKRMSGRTHVIASGISVVAIVDGKVNHLETMSVQTSVAFKSLSEHEIDAYWASGEPADKAGGYGIQGLGSVFVQGIKGSYSNVVGLPLKETAELLQRHGLNFWDSLSAKD